MITSLIFGQILLTSDNLNINRNYDNSQLNQLHYSTQFVAIIIKSPFNQLLKLFKSIIHSLSLHILNPLRILV